MFSDTAISVRSDALQELEKALRALDDQHPYLRQLPVARAALSHGYVTSAHNLFRDGQVALRQVGQLSPELAKQIVLARAVR